MKLDVLHELKKYHGRVLLHDEEGDINSFSVIVINNCCEFFNSFFE